MILATFSAGDTQALVRVAIAISPNEKKRAQYYFEVIENNGTEEPATHVSIEADGEVDAFNLLAAYIVADDPEVIGGCLARLRADERMAEMIP